MSASSSVSPELNNGTFSSSAENCACFGAGADVSVGTGVSAGASTGGSVGNGISAGASTGDSVGNDVSVPSDCSNRAAAGSGGTVPRGIGVGVMIGAFAGSAVGIGVMAGAFVGSGAGVGVLAGVFVGSAAGVGVLAGAFVGSGAGVGVLTGSFVSSGVSVFVETLAVSVALVTVDPVAGTLVASDDFSAVFSAPDISSSMFETEPFPLFRFKSFVPRRAPPAATMTAPMIPITRPVFPDPPLPEVGPPEETTGDFLFSE